VNFVRDGKTYFYNGAYDERQGDLSPGTVLHAAAIEDSIRQGITEYDFLSGDEPYKDRWATGRRDIYHLTLHSGRPASLAAQGALVEFRWALRRSEALKAGRARVLTAVRRIVRRPAVQEQQS
jgi:CelD/BcsL family acetyltransferase involved in cellulose biosynthesis